MENKDLYYPIKRRKMCDWNKPIKDIGRAWVWKKEPPQYTHCRKEDHITSDYDLKPGKVVRKLCLDCRIVWEEKVNKEDGKCK